MARKEKNNDLFASMRIDFNTKNEEKSEENTPIVKNTYNDNKNEKEDNAQRIFKTTDYDKFIAYPKEKLRLTVYDGAAREQLFKSIKELGITTPIKVIKASDYPGYENHTDKYIILGGHNRHSVGKELGIEIPYMIFDGLSESQMDQIVAEEHLLNRQINDLKPSQIYELLKALQYDEYGDKISLESMMTKLSENAAFSFEQTNVYRYLRLEKLLPKFLYDWLDNEKMALRTALELTTIPKKNQETILEFLDNNNITSIAWSQTEKLAQAYKEHKDLTYETINEVFLKPQKKVTKVSLSIKEFKDIIPDEDIPNAKEIMIKALKMYYNISEN